MKRLIPFLVLVTLLAPAFSVSAQTSASIGRGARGDEVRSLQEALKSSPSIYPEGLVTGYYGPLTEKAVKKLQREYNLSETGIFDSVTREFIFPSNLRLTIISPNGGDTWRTSEYHMISWEAVIGPTRWPLPYARTDQVNSRPVPAPYPFSPKATLTLINNSNPSLRRHIATVNLLDASYNWRIPSKIVTSENYRVEISVAGWARDVSDGVFTIKGDDGGVDPDVVLELRKQIKELAILIDQLSAVLRAMSRLLGSL